MGSQEAQQLLVDSARAVAAAIEGVPYGDPGPVDVSVLCDAARAFCVSEGYVKLDSMKLDDRPPGPVMFAAVEPGSAVPSSVNFNPYDGDGVTALPMQFVSLPTFTEHGALLRQPVTIMECGVGYTLKDGQWVRFAEPIADPNDKYRLIPLSPETSGDG